ncbi:Helicase, C-terminal,Helicase superfamily 1/2, ATP-binding domain,P-loop containing nucleoside [Cinara cedri]|uniref:Helicase, C-terminal,Helicase superfamily 1/2, ATP-binding domain,P-loop containing nucleoside n=1 Tax=Cinara cedri TaxID=506608 RepID=A0A5E4M708_9HEMI|nr:Helicase, C-terminal,Helicase superfamily 1/2, ATP-binding domain,P-loop containing nucleoside [Cinara cedri]
MSSLADQDAPGPSSVGDLRSFRFAKKPSFSHESAGQSSSMDTIVIDEEPVFTKSRNGRVKPIILSSDDDEECVVVNNQGSSAGVIEIIDYEDKLPVKSRTISISDDDSNNSSSVLKNETSYKNSSIGNSLTPVAMPSRKRVQPQNKKRKRIKANAQNSDSDGGGSEDYEEYKEEKNFVKDSNKEMREKALELLNIATEAELRVVKGMTTKKFDSIVALRPFSSWIEAVKKVNNSRLLGEQTLQNVMHMISCQDIVTQLMKKCEKLALKNGNTITTTNMLIKSQPSSLNKDLQLSGYQMIGLNWLMLMNSQKLNMMLADEMGLGKTIQVIAFLAYLKESGRTIPELPQLIVVPASTLDNWYQEFGKWCPSIKVEKYHGPMEERKYLRTQWSKYGFGDIDVILTTYSCASNSLEEKKLFKTKEFHYIVFDEAHKLKNMTSQTFEVFSNFNANYKILLTGTPLQNNLLELMSLLIFLMPQMFRGKVDNIKFLFSKGTKGTGSKFEINRIEQAKQIIEPFMLRRLKADVLKSLPVKNIEVKNIAMTEHQQMRYVTLTEEIKEASLSKELTENNHMMWLMMLRKLANHPLLLRYHFVDDKLYKMAELLAVDPTYKQKNKQYIAEDLSFLSDFELHKLCTEHKCLNKLGYDLPIQIFCDSGKFNMLKDILPNLKENGHRVLIFSQFLSILDLLEIFMSHYGHSYLRLDGSTQVQERQLMIDLYNMDESIFAFLLSTKAGGLGINLTAADTVILHDIDYNPYNDKQAEDRCHRVGQTKPVSVIKLISKDSIEESMFKIAQDKLNLEQQVTGGNDEDEATVKKTMAELLKQSLGIKDVTL